MHDLHVPEREMQAVLLGIPDADHLFSAADELTLCGTVPQGVVIHMQQKRHVIVVVVFHDKLDREIGDMLLVHHVLLVCGIDPSIS